MRTSGSIGSESRSAIPIYCSGWGSLAEVTGRGKVHFYDAKRTVEKGNPDYEALEAGGRYELKERKILSGK